MATASNRPPATAQPPAAPNGGDAQQAPPAPAPEAPAAASAPAAKKRMPLVAGAVVRESNGNTTVAGLALLQLACEAFGIDPTAKGKKSQILGWVYYGPDPNEDREASVRLVTAGGAKLRWPMDEPTEEIVRRLLGAFRMDAVTKQQVAIDLPQDLTLPTSAIDPALAATTKHQYKGGYLRRQVDKEQ